MGIFLVEENITIESNTTDVWKHMVSFVEQRRWSPWFTIENSSTLNISGNDWQVGAVESWEWKVIGSWEREITNIVDGELLDYSVRFKLPFKTRARTYMALQKCGTDCSTVIWGMEGNLPWYMRFMKKKLQSSIEADYKRWLDMLKYLAETGNTPTHLQVQGTTQHHETFTLGIERTSPASDIPQYMWKDFKTLKDFVVSHKTWAHGVRSYYTNVDMKKDSYTYRSSVLLSKDEFLELEEPKLKDTIKKYYYKEWKTYSLRMTGSYSFMWHAWNALFMHIGVKKLKIDTKMPGFEDYINDPSTTPEDTCITDLCMYVK